MYGFKNKSEIESHPAKKSEICTVNSIVVLPSLKYIMQLCAVSKGSAHLQNRDSRKKNRYLRVLQ